MSGTDLKRIYKNMSNIWAIFSFFWYYTIFYEMIHLKKTPFFFSQTHDFAAQNPNKCWFTSPEAET